MWERIKHILIKEILQIKRDKRMLMIIFMAPILQVILFGYAATTDIDRIPTAILDFSKTLESREFISLFQNSSYFSITYFPQDEKNLIELLQQGKVWLGIQIKNDYAEELKKGNITSIQIIIDGINSNTASAVSAYLNKLLYSYNQKENLRRTQQNSAQVFFTGALTQRKTPWLENQMRVWYNPQLKSRDYNLPGVLALILMITTMMLTSMAIVREKEIGTIEQLMVTPIRTVELIVGKITPFVLIGFIDVILITLVAILWFRIPFRGSFLFLLLAVGVYLLTTIGVGLFFSTLSKTQQQAMMLTFFFVMPALILSGFMFPIANMPPLIQYLSYVNPLRYFLVIVRGIFLKGSNFYVLWDQILVLGIIGVVVLVLSIVRFQKKID